MGVHVRYVKWNVVNWNQSRLALTQLLRLLFEKWMYAIWLCMTSHCNSASRVAQQQVEHLVIYLFLEYLSCELWSSQLWTQFKQFRIEAWKRRDFNGVWTRNLAIPVRRYNQLSYEATDVESWSFVSSNEPVNNRCEVIYEIKWYMKWYMKDFIYHFTIFILFDRKFIPTFYYLRFILTYATSTYSYFKKCSRGERRMSIVERRLHDWKEMWVLNINRK